MVLLFVLFVKYCVIFGRFIRFCYYLSGITEELYWSAPIILQGRDEAGSKGGEVA